MFEKFINKKIKVVYRDDKRNKIEQGILLEIGEEHLVMSSIKGYDRVISLKSIVTLHDPEGDER